MKADVAKIGGKALVTVTGEHGRVKYLTVAEARELAHQLSRSAAMADAMNRHGEALKDAAWIERQDANANS